MQKFSLAILMFGVTAGITACSNTAALKKPDGVYVITAKGDSRSEVMSDAKDQALDQCSEHDFGSFTIIKQKLLSPDDELAKDRTSNSSMSGATLDGDTDTSAMVSNSGQYQLTWQIRCTK
ncbi:hypothetical protein [Gallaecimonas mangrovi]|uniref:hypothetical protein n=1 Tax=Gallaecimonas mangrovi TaxID=2291597 RepID=UPI000E20C623|nr:hypothetical protein [Gallaecimonas mangrovi]